MKLKKVIVIGASNSSQSINRQLAKYAAKLLDENIDKVHINLRDFEMPTYNVDTEKNVGCPKTAYDFLENFSDFDGLILSTAEHNRNITSAFKNILDWISRIELHFLKEKPILLMSTSPGGFGGQNARNAMEAMVPMFKGNIVAKYSLPKFHENFDGNGINNASMKLELLEAIKEFQNKL